MARGTTIILASLILVGGCATRYDDKHHYDQGWRIGEVIAAGSGMAHFPFSGIDCRANLPPAFTAGQRYAYVQFDFSPARETAP